MLNFLVGRLLEEKHFGQKMSLSESVLPCMLWLVAYHALWGRCPRYFYHLARLDGLQQCSYLGHERLECRKTIVLCYQDDDTKSDVFKVLLVLKILIGSQKDIELTLHQPQQFAVFQT